MLLLPAVVTRLNMSYTLSDKSYRWSPGTRAAVVAAAVEERSQGLQPSAWGTATTSNLKELPNYGKASQQYFLCTCHAKTA